MDEGLPKSRRNLIAVSIAIVFIELADVSFDSVSVLNATVKVQRWEVILWFIWSSWCYLLVRYLQHLLELEDLGIATQFRSHTEGLVNPRIAELLSKHASNVQFVNFGYRNLKRISYLSWVQPLEVFDASAQKVMPHGNMPVSRWLIFAAWVRSFFVVSLLRTKITEHYFPLVIAAAALAAVLWA